MQLKVKHFIFLIYCGFILRLLVAFWNGFFGPSPGADLDAQGLYNYAVAVSQNLQFDELRIGYVPYTNVLGFIFHFTVPSLFLGSVISCFAWLWSGHIFLKILDFMEASSRSKFKAAFIYSFYPSSILYTSVTLREPFQLLFLTLSVYCALKIYYRGNAMRFLSLITYIFLMAMLHGAMLITGIALLAGSILLYSLKNKYKISYVKVGAAALVISPLIIYLVSYSFTVSYDFSDGLVNAAQSYQDVAISIGGRTNYKSTTEYFGGLGILWFAVFGFFQYMFEPFPWNIGIPIDGLVMLEGFLRFYLLFLAYKNFQSRSGGSDFGWIFVLFVFFIAEFTWSLGTVNWGTGMRHHVPAFFCLLVVAFSAPERLRRPNTIQGHRS